MIVPYIHGADWERSVFGCTTGDFPKPDYVAWQDDIEEVAANQRKFGWNPKIPKTRNAQKIFMDVQRRLDRNFREQLELYCAIGTSLDWYFGTDAFFRVGRYFVPIDLTSNREKASMKSDVVMILAHDVLGTKLGRPCRRIARIFNKSLRGLGYGCETSIPKL